MDKRYNQKGVLAPSKHDEPQKEESTQMLQDRLRDSYIQYKEIALRCQIQFKTRGASEKTDRLYYSPNVPFFEEPEKQKNFRKDFINDVSRLPEPKPIYTLADILHSDVAIAIGDRSTPTATKQELIQFYTRRQAQLQHRKHKLIKRWANTVQSAETVDRISQTFDKEISQLQIEQDSIVSRLMRLQPDDRYSHNDANQRPKPTSQTAQEKDKQEISKLYKESDEQTNDSALKLDDFEVFLRHTTYNDKINRPALKLIQGIKWLPYEKCHEIWSDSRIMMNNYNKDYLQKRFNVMFVVANEVKQKLAEIGIVDEKGITACTERYVYHLKDGFISRTQQLLNSQKFTHQEPFMLFAGKAELKFHLEKIAASYGLNSSQVDLDQGQMFTYQLQTFFPPKFEQQVRTMTFDWEDTGANADMQIIDRLTRSLALNKDQIITDMAKISAEQRSASLLNALNVGKTGQADLTLKDLTENELNKDEFIRHNLIKKLKQIEFFTLEESSIKMRKADWLDYVCWQPTVNVYVQRQNQHFSALSNRLDHLLKAAFEFADVNDSVIVNKIIDDAIKVHITKIAETQTRISQCKSVHSNMKGTEAQTDGVTRSLIEATNPAIAREMAKKGDQSQTEAQQIQFQKYQEIPNVDPITQSLAKAYHTLRLIKTRDLKCKLLSVVNYFRGVQRILALDTREFMTRERAQGDHMDIIDPHFGQNSKGQQIVKIQPPAGPSEIFNSTVAFELDSTQIKGENQTSDSVTFKAFKLRNQYDPIAISTCPIVPKHHRTFGRPPEYQQGSCETENEKFKSPKQRMKSLLTMRDKIHVSYETKEIYVTNEFGMPIVYYESLNDLQEIEEELIKIGSYYINQYEFVIQNNEILGISNSQIDAARPTSLIDRSQMTTDLLEKEYEFQWAKVRIIETLMECYEHTIDPLDSMRVLQIIVDLIVARPRLNTEASMYCESYLAETEALHERHLLMTEFLQFQKDNEVSQNQLVQNYLETKIRKLQECVDRYWVVERAKDKKTRVGSNETQQPDADQQNVDNMLRQNLQNSEKIELQKQEQIAQIKQRHITEFANEQYADFASVLGLPQVTLEQLYQRFDESEPIVLDALRETAFFQNMVEGYPRPFTKIPILQPLGQHLLDCGIQDFYDSFATIAKFNAAIVQCLEALERETFPENGFAASCLEVCLLKKARIALKQQKSFIIEGKVDPDNQKGQEFFEEDLYLGNPDQLVFQMKQFHAQCHPDQLYRLSNPLVISKLDCESVENFNFPRIKAKEVVDALQMDGVDQQSISDFLIQKTIQMAKNSVARPNLSYVGTQHYDKDLSAQEANDLKRKTELKVNVPSIMKMCCNIMEVMRLREEIIMRMNESSILARIYDSQCAVTGKSAKYSINEPVSFATNQVNADNMNIVDLNDGVNLKFSTALPFMEFDRSLSANLDFKSDSCIKVLFTDLGVEELRAVLHLQIAHQHLLTVAVKTNQILIDKPLRGLAELDLIDKKEITTPNSIIDLWSILGGNTDTANLGMIKSERMRMKQFLTKSAADCLYMLLPKKQRDRQILVKRFTQVQQKLLAADSTSKPELILRILRSYRLQLCHGYSQSMLQEAQKDSIKIQVLETCNVLRLRATLLPKSQQIFRMGKSETQENLSFEANSYLRKTKQFETTENSEMSLNQIINGQVCTTTGTMFYIPSQEEICFMDRISSNNRVLKEHTQDYVAAETIDTVVKSLVQSPQFLSNTLYKLEGNQQYGVRKVWLEESLNLINLETFQTLVYYSQILNIFDLEYTMLRNLSKSWQSQALESQALSGRPFWAEIQKKKLRSDERQMEEHMLNETNVTNKTSMKIIQHLDERKKQWIDLEEDISAIALKMKTIQSHCFDMPTDKRTLSQFCDLFTLQHQATYFAFLNGLENMIEYYLDKKNDEHFYKLLLVRDQLTNKNIQSVAIVKSNGFYIQQQQIAASSINLDSSKLEEYRAFESSIQTVIDEKCLVPTQVTLLKQLFGQQSCNKVRETRFGYQDLLLSAFYNMDDDSRALMGANFTHVDEYINDYLVFKGLKEAPGETKNVMKSKDHYLELLLAQVEILSYKIEASQLERVIMCWDQPFIPKTTQQFHLVQRKFRDTHTMSILRERDSLNDMYWRKQNKQNPVKHLTKAEKEKELLAGLFSAKMQQQSYFSKVNQLRAEISVIKNILDVKLIKIGIDMVSNEHAALQVCFDVAAEDKVLQIYVHPSQQFASTPYAKVDQAPHLDVVTKIGCLQQFLTRLKNRSTEVETLTSGPGLVFSMKDFNDCLSLFARQLIKYGEEELRGRTETQNLREYQYHHMIYIKQMEALYYRKKCEQLLQNVDNLTNAKMLSQGNQIIFELDVGARELQTLKDHYYIMERCIRKEIRKEFQNNLLEKDALIEKQKDDFGQFRREINIGLSEEVTKEINTLESQIKQKNNLRQSSTKYLKVDQPEAKSAAPEMISEILKLTKFIRTQKIFFRFKQMYMQEKHEKELAAQKEKLTQNMGLWESLAESEKREQITQQELTITKNNLMHYERLIEKLYSQLEHINNQKLRLEQYKKNRSKQINELESKMQDLEILESLDLNKILEEIRQRDKKIVVLDKVDQNFNQRLEQLQGVFQQETDELKKTIQKERQAKQEAFEKLDAMRIEMKSLEGKDTVKNDLWKNKCKELYDVCKQLQDENDRLKLNLKDLNHQLQQKNYEVASVTMHNSTSEQSATMSREQIILQRRKLIGKPMTATSEHRNGQKKNTIEGLRVSAQGYDRGKIQRNATGDKHAQKIGNIRHSGATESQYSNQDQFMRAQIGPVLYQTLIPQVSSMPQIKGFHRQADEGQLMVESSRVRK